MSDCNAAVEAITARYGEWMTAIRNGDLEAILDIYADDATYMPPGRASCTGKQRLREVWSSYLQREAFSAEYFPSLHLSDAGDMAYDIGHYRISMKKNGVDTAFEGKYVVVWKKLSDQWKAMVDIDNDNDPASTAHAT